MACEVRWKSVDGGLVWTCGRGLGKDLGSTIRVCYKAGCRGREEYRALSPRALGVKDIASLVRQEHLKSRRGECGSLVCGNVHEWNGDRFCSEGCREKSERYQAEYLEEEMKRRGRPVLWVELECMLCNEKLMRKPWKVKQNRSGAFFCCRAHQEVYMLKHQECRSEESVSEAMLEKKSKRDEK